MKPFQCFFLLAGLGLIQAASADSTLEYLVAEGNSKTGKIQPVIIKDGKIMVKGVGGDGNLGFIYSANPEILFILDHGKRSVMTLDEGQINRIGKQAETAQPLLQGLGQQLSKLDPAKRKQWEEMLGGKIHLDTIAEAAKPVQTTKIVKTGKTKKLADVACEQMEVYQGKTKTTEFCIADPAKLDLSEADYATIRSFLSFLERVSSKTQGLAKQFGVNLPNLDLRDIVGVPIELREVSSHNQTSVKINRVVTQTVSTDEIKIPDGYQFVPFKLWN